MSDQLAEEITRILRAREPTSEAWNIAIEAAGEGYARIRMVLRRDMLNGHGAGHGGILFAFADTAFGYACNSRNVRTVAAEASIVFLRPAREGDTLIAEARERSAAGRSGIFDVSVARDDGVVLAEFRGYSRAVGGDVIEHPDGASEAP
jgi:acyl-CoA thioesterase